MTGLTATQADILENALENNSLFQTYLPCPEDLEGEEKFNWFYDNWGTKWMDTIDVKREGNNISAATTTAWAPPLAAIANIASKFYPEALFEVAYSEAGMDFMGVAMVKGDTFTKAEGSHARTLFYEFLCDEGRMEEALLWDEGDISDALEDEFYEKEADLMDAKWEECVSKCKAQMAKKAVVA